MMKWIALLVLFVAGQASAEVVFRSDFESSTWYRGWGLSRASENTRVVSDGSRVAEVTVRKGSHKGVDNLAWWTRPGMGFEPSQLYVRYRMKLMSDWRPAMNGKLPGFAGTYKQGGWGGEPANGYNGWSARSQWIYSTGDTIPMASYVYHMDQATQYGDSWRWSRSIRRGRWYTIEQHIRLNDPGAANGVLQVWMDGALVLDRKGIRFRATDSLRIERLWMDVYHGGGKVAPRDMHVRFDDVVISTTRIGGS